MASKNIPQRNRQLRNARIQKLLTIRELATLAQVSESTYMRWESGKQQPHLINLQALCDALGTDPKSLGFDEIAREEDFTDEAARQQQQKIQRLEAEIAMLRRDLEALSTRNRSLERTVAQSASQARQLAARNEELERT